MVFELPLDAYIISASLFVALDLKLIDVIKCQDGQNVDRKSHISSLSHAKLFKKQVVSLSEAFMINSNSTFP